MYGIARCYFKGNHIYSVVSIFVFNILNTSSPTKNSAMYLAFTQFNFFLKDIQKNINNLHEGFDYFVL